MKNLFLAILFTTITVCGCAKSEQAAQDHSTHEPMNNTTENPDAPLEVGAPAPVLTATTDTGEILDLGQVYAKGVTLVYFYPKADTPGCTKQACNLRDAYAAVSDAGITVIGVSMDDVEAQAAFKAKYHLPFTLLADLEGTVVDAFGVPNDTGRAKRQAFLVKDGKIAWRDLQATPTTQAQDALAALAALKMPSGG